MKNEDWAGPPVADTAVETDADQGSVRLILLIGGTDRQDNFHHTLSLAQTRRLHDQLSRALASFGDERQSPSGSEGLQ
jgi:hypothetical protein